MNQNAVNPSQEIQRQFQLAYDHFNQTLFSSQLPQCFLCMNRKGRAMGLFSRSRWCDKSGAEIHEVALNPARFAEATLKEVLGALVREQCRVWQHKFGKPGRASYYNSEWANIMERVGLMPSDTGEPGGKRTGQQVRHYVVRHGPFERACDSLLKKGFAIDWIDRNFVTATWPVKKVTVRNVAAKHLVTTLNSRIATRFRNLSHWSTHPPKARNKVKYSCPMCETNLWGKPDLEIECATCKRRFRAAKGKKGSARA